VKWRIAALFARFGSQKSTVKKWEKPLQQSLKPRGEAVVAVRATSSFRHEINFKMTTWISPKIWRKSAEMSVDAKQETPEGAGKLKR
jgi:hypothetical protein